MSTKPIDGVLDLHIDDAGFVRDENYVPVKPQKDEDGRHFVMVSGQKRYVDELVFTHFANDGKGASVRKDQELAYKDDNFDNPSFDNLSVKRSTEDKKEEVLGNAEADDVEKQIIELFIEDNEATYDDITDRMQDRFGQKVSRNQIASAKKAWKKAMKEAGQN